jgi:hypothetical protein
MFVVRCSSPQKFALYWAVLAIWGCSPLSQKPSVGGPSDERQTVAAAPLRTRELVWVSQRRIVRISLGAHLCRQGPSGEACVRLSRSDRHELDRFFGTEAFRERWVAFGACPARTVLDESESFAVTYADGERIAKPLDAPLGSPRTRRCDRATRDAISAVGDDLVERYFR